MDADIYVLANSRRTEDIIKILDIYLPIRTYWTGSHRGKFEFWDEAKDYGDQPQFFSKLYLSDKRMKNSKSAHSSQICPKAETNKSKSGTLINPSEFKSSGQALLGCASQQG